MSLLRFSCRDIDLQCYQEERQPTQEEHVLLSARRAFVEAPGPRATWQKSEIPYSYWERSQLVLLAYDYMMVSFCVRWMSAE